MKREGEERDVDVWRCIVCVCEEVHLSTGIVCVYWCSSLCGDLMCVCEHQWWSRTVLVFNRVSVMRCSLVYRPWAGNMTHCGRFRLRCGASSHHPSVWHPAGLWLPARLTSAQDPRGLHLSLKPVRERPFPLIYSFALWMSLPLTLLTTPVNATSHVLLAPKKTSSLWSNVYLFSTSFWK